MAKIMISLPQEFLKKVDLAAKAQGRSRSELTREALRTLLSESQGDRRSWKEALAPLKELERQWVGRWNSTDIVHRNVSTTLRHRRHAFTVELRPSREERPFWRPGGSGLGAAPGAGGVIPAAAGTAGRVAGA